MVRLNFFLSLGATPPRLSIGGKEKGRQIKQEFWLAPNVGGEWPGGRLSLHPRGDRKEEARERERGGEGEREHVQFLTGSKCSREFFVELIFIFVWPETAPPTLRRPEERQERVKRLNYTMYLAKMLLQG